MSWTREFRRRSWRPDSLRSNRSIRGRCARCGECVGEGEVCGTYIAAMVPTVQRGIHPTAIISPYAESERARSSRSRSLERAATVARKRHCSSRYLSGRTSATFVKVLARPRRCPPGSQYAARKTADREGTVIASPLRSNRVTCILQDNRRKPLPSNVVLAHPHDCRLGNVSSCYVVHSPSLPIEDKASSPDSRVHPFA